MNSIQDIWKSMGDARRQQATSAFYQDDSLKEFHNAANTLIARAKNFRPQFVKKLPVEKRAIYLSNVPMGQDMLSQFIVSYHFTHQRPMMAAFLDALGIPNDNGLISDTAEEPSKPSKEKLAEAAKLLRAKFPPEDVDLYFSTLRAQNHEIWGELE
jgi:hypothetical protein